MKEEIFKFFVWLDKEDEVIIGIGIGLVLLCFLVELY